MLALRVTLEKYQKYPITLKHLYLT